MGPLSAAQSIRAVSALLASLSAAAFVFVFGSAKYTTLTCDHMFDAAATWASMSLAQKAFMVGQLVTYLQPLVLLGLAWRWRRQEARLDALLRWAWIGAAAWPTLTLAAWGL